VGASAAGRGREGALLEVDAHDRHGGDGRRRGNAQVAQRRDETAPRGVAQREVVDRSGEDVGHLLRDEVLRSGHPDVQGLVEGANSGARLLPEGRVRLVAEDEVVGLPIELASVAREPGICLDGDRVVARGMPPGQNGVGEAVRISLGREVALELRDEKPSMREDQDTEATCGLDESSRCDGLAGGGRVAEAIATDGARICPAEARLEILLLDEAGVEVVVGLLVQLGLDDDAVAAAPVPVLVRRALRFRDYPGQPAGEPVDLVPAQPRSRSRSRRVLGQDPLEPEHQPVANLPACRRLRPGGLHLRDRVVERSSPRGARSKRGDRILVGLEEGLANPALGAMGCSGQVLGCVRRQRRDDRRLVHSRSTYSRAAPSEELTLAC